jgi:short-subunit dehydrogenase
MCRVDVTNREKVLETGKKVLNEVGIISILINNAGIMPQHQLLKHTEKEIRSIFEINVLAHFWILEAFLPKMIEMDRGHVVALSSMAGLMGSRNLVKFKLFFIIKFLEYQKILKIIYKIIFRFHTAVRSLLSEDLWKL